jgi:hypothetical protein
VVIIPQSLRTEHEETHQALMEATRAPGRVGAAAKELAAVLDPHFERENQIALPPLGLLAPSAAAEPRAGLQEGLTMTDDLRKELPRMLEEHTSSASPPPAPIESAPATRPATSAISTSCRPEAAAATTRLAVDTMPRSRRVPRHAVIQAARSDDAPGMACRTFARADCSRRIRTLRQR